MRNLKELEQKYLELGKEIKALKKQNAEKEEITYPIYCKFKDSSLVIKFTELKSGEVVINNSYYSVGYKCYYWKEHTDKNEWQQLEVCPETGFFDGQLVLCWDNNTTHMRILKFYEAKRKGTYQFDGTRCGVSFDNYEPFEGNYPDWSLEAFQTLER